MRTAFSQSNFSFYLVNNVYILGLFVIPACGYDVRQLMTPRYYACHSSNPGRY